MATATDTAEKCANRGCSNALDTTGTPKWCKECRARYQREYRILNMSRAEASGFVKGREAMREMVAQEFGQLGAATFSGDEIAALVERMPGPQVSDSGR